jgi:hypothetical protein
MKWLLSISLEMESILLDAMHFDLWLTSYKKVMIVTIFSN